MNANGNEKIVLNGTIGAEIWIHIGNERFSRGDHAGAIESYDHALGDNPRLAQALNAKANALAETGKYTDAVRFYDLALASDPFDADCMFNKGIALSKLGHTDQARSCTDNAIRAAMGN